MTIAIRMEGKAALVTGAAQGMGRAICRRFGEFGAKVVAVDIKLEAAAETIADLGERGLALACNVADAEAVRQAFDLEINRLEAIRSLNEAVVERMFFGG